VFSGIGPTELIIVLVIVLIIFGPKRLPGLGKQLGRGMREFKDSISSRGKDDDDEDDAPLVTAAGDDGRREAEVALGHPDGEPAPVDGRVVRDGVRR
jgi:sec-independent protein translocase protein TatA